MKALITYFTMGGRTRRAAKAIASSLTNYEVDFFGIECEGNFIERIKMLDKFEKDDFSLVEEGLSNLDAADYDLIVIAHGVEPKEKILERVMKDKPNGVSVLYRTTWEILDVFYGSEWLPDQAIIKKVYYRPDLIKSIILEGAKT